VPSWASAWSSPPPRPTPSPSSPTACTCAPTSPAAQHRNTKPTICFIWEADAPQDGDSIASRILTRGGVEVVDLGTGDQWIDGAGEGCEIPSDDRFRQVFANPGNHVVEFRVVENQGTPVTGPVRSGPLQRASG
jgi:hypothetical protein